MLLLITNYYNNYAPEAQSSHDYYYFVAIIWRQ